MISKKFSPHIYAPRVFLMVQLYQWSLFKLGFEFYCIWDPSNVLQDHYKCNVESLVTDKIIVTGTNIYIQGHPKRSPLLTIIVIYSQFKIYVNIYLILYVQIENLFELCTVFSRLQ